MNRITAKIILWVSISCYVVFCFIPLHAGADQVSPNPIPVFSGEKIDDFLWQPYDQSLFFVGIANDTNESVQYLLNVSTSPVNRLKPNKIPYQKENVVGGVLNTQERKLFNTAFRTDDSGSIVEHSLEYVSPNGRYVALAINPAGPEGYTLAIIDKTKKALYKLPIKTVGMAHIKEFEVRWAQNSQTLVVLVTIGSDYALTQIVGGVVSISPDIAKSQFHYVQKSKDDPTIFSTQAHNYDQYTGNFSFPQNDFSFPIVYDISVDGKKILLPVTERNTETSKLLLFDVENRDASIIFDVPVDLIITAHFVPGTTDQIFYLTKESIMYMNLNDLTVQKFRHPIQNAGTLVQASYSPDSKWIAMAYKKDVYAYDVYVLSSFRVASTTCIADAESASSLSEKYEASNLITEADLAGKSTSSLCQSIMSRLYK